MNSSELHPKTRDLPCARDDHWRHVGSGYTSMFVVEVWAACILGEPFHHSSIEEQLFQKRLLQGKDHIHCSKKVFSLLPGASVESTSPVSHVPVFDLMKVKTAAWSALRSVIRSLKAARASGSSSSAAGSRTRCCRRSGAG